MGAEGHVGWQAAAASLVDWWVEAGLDTLTGDEARDWLAPVVAPSPPLPPSVAVPSLPQEWAAFSTWRCGEQAPEAGWPGGWIAASGPARAGVMVLADCPDRDDLREDPCSLLSGAPGRLFDRMLAAIGLTREEVHLAAVCAKRPVAGRLPPEAAARLAEVALHHVALVRPRALLLLGDAASRAVLTMDVREARGRLHELNHDAGQAGEQPAGASTSVSVSRHPRFLLDRPAYKAESWADLRLLKRVLETR